jgi:hypothetical protein
VPTLDYTIAYKNHYAFQNKGVCSDEKVAAFVEDLRT